MNLGVEKGLSYPFLFLSKPWQYLCHTQCPGPALGTQSGCIYSATIVCQVLCYVVFDYAIAIGLPCGILAWLGPRDLTVTDFATLLLLSVFSIDLWMQLHALAMINFSPCDP
jgi:hypothetical protein